jgi:hypothetical protein
MIRVYSTHVKRSEYKILLEKSPLERSRCRWEVIIVMCMGDYKRGLDWRLELLATSTHDS